MTAVLIGGPAGAGKSTLATLLVRDSAFYPYRPSQAYLDLAHLRGVPRNMAFSQISQTDAEDFFLSACGTCESIVSEVHYAIQFERDSALATGAQLEGGPYCEPYEAAMTSRLVELLVASGREVWLILLVAPAPVLLERVIRRSAVSGHPVRIATVEGFELELEAECREWKVLCRCTGANSAPLSSMVSPGMLFQRLTGFLRG